MRFLTLAAVLALAAALVAPVPAQAPRIPPDYADLSYGPYANNKLDLWLAKSPGPHPLVVFIHGGGFVNGDKRGVSQQALRRALDAGVSFASINYRFRSEEVPLPAVLRDCARAVQFLRYKAPQFHIDKTRIAAFGGSAGAGTSLWLAFHDDLADPRSPDPVLRESTRLTAAASISGQATYDILKWKDILGEAAAPYAREAAYPQLYGFKTPEELHTPAAKKVRADVDMLGLITKDDPPVYLIASSRFDGLRSLGDVQHSSRHSAAVKKRCDEVGVPAVLRIVAGQPNTETGDDSPIGFLLRRLLKKR